MPYRISYGQKGNRMVHGGYDQPATFRTKKAARNYKARFHDTFSGKNAVIYFVKTGRKK